MRSVARCWRLCGAGHNGRWRVGRPCSKPTRRPRWSRGRFVELLRGLVPADRKGESRAAGKVDHPHSLTVVSLSGDERGLAIGPQLAAFASSLGIATRLVATMGHERAADPMGGLRHRHQVAARPNLLRRRRAGRGGDRSDDPLVVRGSTAAQARRPVRPALPRFSAVAAGTATEQELARVAVAVDDAGRRIDGIVVADPDQTDRTSGRHTMDERSRRPRYPRASRASHHLTVRRQRPATGSAHDLYARSDAPDFDDDEQTRPNTPGPCSGEPAFHSLCAAASLACLRAVRCSGPTRGRDLPGRISRRRITPRRRWCWHTDRGRPHACHGHRRQSADDADRGEETIASVGLTMTPDDFLKSLTAEPSEPGPAVGHPHCTERRRGSSSPRGPYVDLSQFRAEQLSLAIERLRGWRSGSASTSSRARSTNSHPADWTSSRPPAACEQAERR